MLPLSSDPSVLLDEIKKITLNIVHCHKAERRNSFYLIDMRLQKLLSHYKERIDYVP